MEMQVLMHALSRRGHLPFAEQMFALALAELGRVGRLRAGLEVGASNFGD